MSVILSKLGLIIFVLIDLISTFLMLFTDIKGRKWYQLIDKKAFQKALNIDIFGNYQFKEFWNLTMSKNGYQFGRFGETLSSCLGRKQLERSLSWFGWFILLLVNLSDFSKWKSGFKGNGFHCVASIQTHEEINNFINK